MIEEPEIESPPTTLPNEQPPEAEAGNTAGPETETPQTKDLTGAIGNAESVIAAQAQAAEISGGARPLGEPFGGTLAEADFPELAEVPDGEGAVLITSIRVTGRNEGRIQFEAVEASVLTEAEAQATKAAGPSVGERLKAKGVTSPQQLAKLMGMGGRNG